MAVRTFHAPGRVNLIGEHTDYSGGLVLPAAIDRGITLVGTAGGDRITLTSDGAEEAVDVPADGAQAPATGWGRYVAAVAAELAAVGREPVGFDGRVASDLPQGSGLSSSAALEVVVALALADAAALELTPVELALLAQRAEHRAVGVPCGVMDQAASLLGREGCAVLLDCATLAHRHVPLPDDLALLVVDSGVPRRLEESGYADRRRELEAGLAALGGASPREVTPEQAAEAVRRAGAGDVAARRLRHVVTENARVAAVAAVLEAPGPVDREALGRLFAEGHASLRDDLEVSIPPIDALVEVAVAAGAVAARLTGGGFGGAIVCLADRADAGGIAEVVVARYGERTRQRASALVTAPSAGAGRRA